MAGERQRGGHHLYDQKIPIIAVVLPNLQQYGPAGAVFLRFGRDHMQPLLDAIGNPRRDAADAREAEEARARQAEYQAQVQRAAQDQAAKKAAEREARRPVCTSCETKFTDKRWETAQATDWGTPTDSHPHLCDNCKHTAVANAHQADQQERPEPLPDWAQRKHFLRFTKRPRCPECKTPFTDERWQAVESAGGAESHPTWCENCVRKEEAYFNSQAYLDSFGPSAPSADQPSEVRRALSEPNAESPAEQAASRTWFSRFRG